MEKNLSEDIDSSFEMFEPIVRSIGDSMSIVAIPESLPAEGATEPASSPSDPITSPPEMSKSPANSFSLVDDQMPTKRMDSVDGLPSYRQIEEQEIFANKWSDVSEKVATDERYASLKTLDNNLEKIEDNANSSNVSELLTNNLETYLKQLRDENDKLKTELERSNSFMKQQLKNLQEWQNKNKELVEDHKRIIDHSKHVSDENILLKEENLCLKEKLNELEAKNIEQIEELNKEVESLRLRCSQMANYEKLDITSELRAQEMTSGLVDSQLKSDALMAELRNKDKQLEAVQSRLREKDSEISSLLRQINEFNHQLDTLDAMKSQLTLFERDFKLEEMSKLAALKEVSELQEKIDELMKAYNELEERLEKGEPVLDLKDDKPRKTLYTCPKCWSRFERIQAIQNHFEHCLDEDGLFT